MAEYNDYELKQMKEQLDMLKEKLAHQEFINEKWLRSSIKTRMSFIKKYLWVAIMAVPFCALVFFFMVKVVHLSWWWYGATLLILIGDVVADWYINYMKDDNFFKGNLVETAHRLLRMKRIRKKAFLIGLVAVAIWMLWLFVELFFIHRHTVSGEPLYYISYAYMIIDVVGGVAGVALGYAIYRRMQRINSAIIRDISELTNKETYQ